MRTRVVIFANAVLRRSGLPDTSGATAIEYALIGTGISVAIIAALFAIGDEIIRLFEIIQTTLAGSGD
ncbi:MAG: Flp family type IVb pilin [Alphaproteobacteria bacterium]|nr:Flp family type IVb pilin [Alphaproteobacteria bacterium]